MLLVLYKCPRARLDWEEKRSIFNLIESICSKPMADTILNGERANAFPLILEARQECLLSFLLNIMMEILGTN